MKIAGIIAEYNPFHTGHAYHIEKTRQNCGADHIICVISGNFTQRGEPAIYDKWVRTHAALLCGADLVLELPFAYASQSAEGFACGGVGILNALGCVDFLSFGAETADISALSDAAEILKSEPIDFKDILKSFLSQGLSFPAARAKALGQFLSNADLWEKPNNILALEYLKALGQTGSSIKPVPVARKGGGYSSAALTPVFSGAHAIRNAMKSGTDAYKQFLPNEQLYHDREPVFAQAMFPFLMFRLRSMTLPEIKAIYDVAEGLEYKITEASKTASNYGDLVEKIKSKRYSYTRIQRILLYCLFGITRDKMAAFRQQMLYARVLGVRRGSLELLARISSNAGIPLVSKASEFPQNELFDLDVRATDIYSLFTKKIAPARRDFTQRLLVI